MEGRRIVFDIDDDRSRCRIAVIIDDLRAEGQRDDIVRIIRISMVEIFILRVGVFTCCSIDRQREGELAIDRTRVAVSIG